MAFWAHPARQVIRAHLARRLCARSSHQPDCCHGGRGGRADGTCPGQEAVRPYTQGAKSDQYNPYTDGARTGDKFDPYTQGANTSAQSNLVPDQKADPYTEGAKAGKYDRTPTARAPASSTPLSTAPSPTPTSSPHPSFDAMNLARCRRKAAPGFLPRVTGPSPSTAALLQRVRAVCATAGAWRLATATTITGALRLRRHPALAPRSPTREAPASPPLLPARHRRRSLPARRTGHRR
jgi:hypothetical protein